MVGMTKVQTRQQLTNICGLLTREMRTVKQTLHVCQQKKDIKIYDQDIKTRQPVSTTVLAAQFYFKLKISTDLLNSFFLSVSIFNVHKVIAQ